MAWASRASLTRGSSTWSWRAMASTLRIVSSSRSRSPSSSNAVVAVGYLAPASGRRARGDGRRRYDSTRRARRRSRRCSSAHRHTAHEASRRRRAWWLRHAGCGSNPPGCRAGADAHRRFDWTRRSAWRLPALSSCRRCTWHEAKRRHRASLRPLATPGEVASCSDCRWLSEWLSVRRADALRPPTVLHGWQWPNGTVGFSPSTPDWSVCPIDRWFASVWTTVRTHDRPVPVFVAPSRPSDSLHRRRVCGVGFIRRCRVAGFARLRPPRPRVATLRSRRPASRTHARVLRSTANSTRDFQITGSLVPATATAVVLNVTATGSMGNGYVQVFPTGQAAIGSSSTLNLDFAGQTIPNAAFAPIGDGGKVTVFTTFTTHIIIDVFGYFVPATSASAGGSCP